VTIEAKFRISADGAQALAALKSLRNEVAATVKEVQRIGPGSSSDQLQASLKKVSAEASKASADLKQTRQAAESVLSTKVGGGGSGLREIGQETAAASQQFRGLSGLFKGGLVLGGAALLLSQLSGIARGLLNAKIEAEKVSSVLNFNNDGDLRATAEDLAYVRRFANELGLELNGTAVQFAKINAAAKGTSLEGEGIRRVFEGVAKAATVFNLSGAETEGVFLALQQMISKGKVSAEELRGQLGERLPGALQIAARALGVTTAELDRMLESGELGLDFLSKFGAQLEKEMGQRAQDAAKGTAQSVQRLENAWNSFKQAIANSGIVDVMATLVEKLTGRINKAVDAIARAKAEGDGPVGQLLAGPAGFLGIGNTGSGVDELLSKRRELAASLESMKGSWAASTLYAKQIYETQQKLVGVQQELDRRNRQSATADSAGQSGSSSSALNAQEAAKNEKLQNARGALKKVLEGAQSDREKIEAERAKFMAQYKAILSPQELAQADEAFSKQLVKGADKNAQVRLAQVRDRFSQEDALQADAIARAERANQQAFDDGIKGYQAYLQQRAALEDQANQVELRQLQAKLDAEREALQKNIAIAAAADSPNKRAAAEDAVARQRAAVAKLETDITIKVRDQAVAAAERQRIEQQTVTALRQQREQIDQMLRRATGTEDADSAGREVRARYEKALESALANDENPEPLLKLIDVEVERAKFELLQREFQNARDSLAVSEAAINADVANGTLSQAEGEAKLLELRRQSADALKQQAIALGAQADKLNEVAGSTQVKETNSARQAATDVKGIADVRTEMEKTARSSAVSSLGDALKGIVTGAKTAGQALRDMVGGFVNSMLDALSRRLADQLVGSFINAAAGSAAGGASGGFLSGAFAAVASIFHEGGIVGSSSAPTRSLPASAWSMAPRYHTGGISGLAPNERPAILQVGEEVLTADDPRHINNGGRRVGGVSISNQVTISGAGQGKGEADSRAAGVSLTREINSVIDQWAARESRPGGFLAPLSSR
jgi:tape measure domain-containing protein